VKTPIICLYFMSDKVRWKMQRGSRVRILTPTHLMHTPFGHVRWVGHISAVVELESPATDIEIVIRSLKDLEVLPPDVKAFRNFQRTRMGP
jgi:hypothetical protein